MRIRAWTINGLAPSAAIPNGVRLTLLRRFGASVGKCNIGAGGRYMGDLRGLSIADGTFLNVEVALFAGGGISIGRDVAIGPRALLMTGTHIIGGPSKRASTPTVYKPIRIGDGAWIGGGAIIQGGVTIGSGAIVAAGAVVTRDVEENSFYAGAPAVKKRSLDVG